MPKARKKKNSAFESSPVKSVFLFGNLNKGKLNLLWQMEHKYVELINFNIDVLTGIPDIHVQLPQCGKPQQGKQQTFQMRVLRL